VNLIHKRSFRRLRTLALGANTKRAPKYAEDKLINIPEIAAVYRKSPGHAPSGDIQTNERPKSKQGRRIPFPHAGVVWIRDAVNARQQNQNLIKNRYKQ
jgi:hypothetical protein